MAATTYPTGHQPLPIDSPAQVLRLCLLTHRLVFMKARGEVNLDPLVEEGLLLPYEKPLLDGRPAKAMVVWSWCVSFDGLCCVGGCGFG
jgi:hypothetical protein